jgi:hypothetical protein
VSDFTPDEQRLASAFAGEPVPAGVEAWREREPRATGTRSSWLRPAAALLAVVVVAGALGSYFGLRGHFTSNSGAASGAYPAARSDAAMAYDEANGSVLMFGGLDGKARALADTWTWNGTGWLQQHPAHSPPALQDAVMAYDSATHSVLLTGGSRQGLTGPAGARLVCPAIAGSSAGSATGTGSAQPGRVTGSATAAAASPPSAPAPLPPSASALAPPPEVVPALPPVLTCLGASVDTWAWNGADWRRVATRGPHLGTGGAATWMATDPGTGRPLLVSFVPTLGLRCALPCPVSLQAWTWSGSAWERPGTSAATPAEPGASGDWSVLGLGIDPVGGRLALVTATPFVSCGEVSPQAAPLGIPPDGGPQPCLSGKSTLRIYDWLTTGWANARELKLGRRGWPPDSVLTDVARHSLVFLQIGRGWAGYSQPPSAGATTLVWDGHNWVSHAGGAPDALNGAAWAFDSGAREIVLFGGLGFKTTATRADNLPVRNTTWTWDGSRWSLRGGSVPKPTTPAPRPLPPCPLRLPAADGPAKPLPTCPTSRGVPLPAASPAWSVCPLPPRAAAVPRCPLPPG